MVESDILGDEAPLSINSAAEALHDISNALTVMLGWLEEAKQSDASPELVAQALQVVTRKAREAYTLARVAIGAGENRDAAQAIGSILNEVINTLALEFEKAHVQVIMQLNEWSQVQVEGASSLVHVFTNLLLNAIAFSPPMASVYVRIDFCDAQFVVVQIEDEGPGIAPEVEKHLFQGASTRKYGAGLGLRRARAVVRSLGGDLYSCRGHKGAIFEVKLARFGMEHESHKEHEPVPQSLRSRTWPPSSIRNARVLIVEDDRAVCTLLEAGLEARGAQLTIVHDSLALTQKLEHMGRFDLALLDLSPIAHNFDSLMHLIQQNNPSMGIVFITGAPTLDLPSSVQGTNHIRWLRKPFEIPEIVSMLEQAIMQQGSVFEDE